MVCGVHSAGRSRTRRSRDSCAGCRPTWRGRTPGGLRSMRDSTLPVRSGTRRIRRSGMWGSFARWVADLVVEDLGDGRDPVVVVDDTRVVGQGTESVGVSRRHRGATGRVGDRRVRVVTSTASRHGHAFPGREPCMPEPWIDDLARRAVAAVPADEKSGRNPGSPSRRPDARRPTG